MKSIELYCLTLLVLTLSPVTASARQDRSVGPGARLRVTVLDLGHPVDGTLVRSDAESIVLDRDGEHTFFLTPDEVLGVEAFRGTRRHPVMGGLVGLAAGLGMLWARSLFEPFCTVYRGDTCVVESRRFIPHVSTGWLLSLPIAAGVGGGFLVKTEEWEAIPWPPPVGPGS